MRKPTGTNRCAALAVALGAAVLLGGCGGGVHLEGPGFERLGLSGNKNKKDAKVPDRAPLLLPPDRARLPEPQSPEQQTASTPQPNWPVDRDITAKEEAIASAKKQKKYEDDGDWSKNAGIDEFEKLSDSMDRRKGGLLDKVFDKSDTPDAPRQ